MRHDKAVVINLQQPAKQSAVFFDSIIRVTAIAVDVERGIIASAHSAMTCGTECHDVVVYMII